MRISPTKLVQLVETTPPTIVIFNEANGEEMELTPNEALNLRRAVDYFEKMLNRAAGPPQELIP